MNFKDLIKIDIEKTFINANDFAEEVNINGENYHVIIDNDTLKEHQLKIGENGLIQNELLFHIRKSEFVNMPFVGQIIEFNFEVYQITNISENLGVLTIILGVASS